MRVLLGPVLEQTAETGKLWTPVYQLWRSDRNDIVVWSVMRSRSVLQVPSLIYAATPLRPDLFMLMSDCLMLSVAAAWGPGMLRRAPSLSRYLSICPTVYLSICLLSVCPPPSPRERERHRERDREREREREHQNASSGVLCTCAHHTWQFTTHNEIQRTAKKLVDRKSRRSEWSRPDCTSKKGDEAN